MESIWKYIKVSIVISVFTGAVLLILNMTILTQKDYRKIFVDQSQQQLLMTAKSTSRSLAEFITMQQNLLKSFATDPLLLKIDSHTDYAQLEVRYKELEGEVGGFYIISPEGIVTHRYPHKNRVGKDFSKKPGVATVLKTHEPFVSELFFSDSGKPCFTVLEPIIANEQLVGILRALTYVETLHKKFFEPLKIGSDGYAWAVGLDQRIILHPNRDYIGKPVKHLVGKESVTSGKSDITDILNRMVSGKEGGGIFNLRRRVNNVGIYTKELTAYTPAILGNQIWSVAVSMDYSEILTPIKAQTRKTFILAAVMVLIFVIVGIIIAGKQQKEAALKKEAENFRRLSEATEALRLSEEKLIRSQKMESLGLLAGGVAHDLNNVLSGIVSYPELLLLNLPDESELRKPIETIRISGLRASAIVQDLLTVARGVAITKEPLSLNEQIISYLESPEFEKLAQFHPAVSVKTKLDSNLLNLKGSSIHVRKVIMNLVSNASEAITGKGNVIISTANRYIDKMQRKYDHIDEGEYTILSVADDGPGIPPGDLERMFEPFYTKKVMGRSGTGLGLAVVWNIVQDHKGYIDVVSNGNGTTFELFFPATREEIIDDDEITALEELKGKGETILIIDDIESQLGISSEMLEKLGYKTISVKSGEDGINYLKGHSVDLILLDMIMEPGMSGKDTYKEIVGLHPKQKAILVSGFAETKEVTETKKLGAGKFIKKPFTISQIGHAVKDELYN